MDDEADGPRQEGDLLRSNLKDSIAVSDERSEMRLQALARLVKGYVFEAVFRSDRSIEFTWAEDVFRRLFDCERDEINLRGWDSFVDARDLVAAQRRVSYVALGISVSMEIRIVSAKGAPRWLRMAAEPVRDPLHGGISGMMGMAEDITERKQLTEQMFESVNREQRRIGSDLHDELGQVLTGASLLLGGCLNQARRGVEVSSPDLEEILGVVKDAIETTRNLAYSLAPGALGRPDFRSALEHLALRARRWSGLNIEFTAHIVRPLALTAVVTDHLYRIVQEAITNVMRHAKAANIIMRLSLDDCNLQVDVVDDGVGYDSTQKSGFGVKTMQYRAHAIGARLEVRRTLPTGTTVSVVLPARLFMR